MTPTRSRTPRNTRRSRLSTRPALEGLERRALMSGGADSSSTGNGLPGPQGATTTSTSVAYDQLPMSFEPNRGQTDARVDFLARGPGYTAFLAPTQAVMALKDGASSDVLRMRLHGSNAHARATGADRQAGVSNYL